MSEPDELLSSAEIAEINRETEGFSEELEEDPTWEKLHLGGRKRRKLATLYGETDSAPS